MPTSDFYKLLGVERSASPDEIRAAYRRLARRYHPDINKSDDAERRFREIQEAYDVLSDPEKRSRYDRFGHVAPGAGRGPHHAWSNVGGSAAADAFETDDLGDMFDAFFSGRGRAGLRSAPRRPRPANIEQDLHISFVTAARGGVERIRLNEGGQVRTIEVTVPRAVSDGAKLRVKRSGNDGPDRSGGSGGGGGGDVILTVRIGKHPIFERTDGLNLTLSLPLTIAEAALGAIIRVPTLDGSVELSIPPGTPSGRKLRLRGCGLADGKGREGDLYALIRIVSPDGSTLDEADREALQRLADAGPRVREGREWPGSRVV
jgi:curved DNA-binding protein